MEVAFREKVFRVGKPQNLALENRFYEFIESCRRLSAELPPSMMIAKAKQIAQTMPKCHNFQASWGWYRMFCRRRGLQSMLLHGEGDEVDQNNPWTIEASQKLEKLVEEYDPYCVYNMDETRLFFCLLPLYSVLLPTEDTFTARGKKKSKERVTLVVCCNATGTERVLVTMIGKSKASACISGRQWPLPYMHQRKAWMDVAVFNEWFERVFRPFVRLRTSRRILLILENTPGHSHAFEKDEIRVIFFPPNVTSWKQPMDMGIIAALKKRYKFLLMKDILSYHDLMEEVKVRLAADAFKLKRGAADIEFGRPAHLLDAAYYVVTSWNAISVEALKNCFKKADIISEFRSGEQSNAPDDGEGNMVNDLVSMMENCFLSHCLSCSEMQLAQELREFLDRDENNSEEYQQAVIEDIEMEFGMDENEDSGTAEVIVENSIETDEKSVKNSIQDILLQVFDLTAKIRNLPGTRFLAQDKIDVLLNNMFTTKNIIQQANSMISSERIV